MKTMELVGYKAKLLRVNRLINIKKAKAYRTVSNEALCIVTGMTHIAIKIEEAAQIYQLTRGNTKVEETQVDSHIGAKVWQTPRRNYYKNTRGHRRQEPNTNIHRWK